MELHMRPKPSPAMNAETETAVSRAGLSGSSRVACLPYPRPHPRLLPPPQLLILLLPGVPQLDNVPLLGVCKLAAGGGEGPGVEAVLFARERGINECPDAVLPDW